MPVVGSRKTISRSAIAVGPLAETGTLEFEETSVVQVLLEVPYADVIASLPEDLTPALPAAAAITVWDARRGPFGAFRVAQFALMARAGARGRSVLVGAVVDGQAARERLAEGWGFCCSAGAIDFRQYHDGIVVNVSNGRGNLGLSVTHLNEVSGRDVQWPTSMHFVSNKTKSVAVDLVQVEPRYELMRVERGRARLDQTSGALWGSDIPFRSVISAVAGFGKMTLPEVRFRSSAVLSIGE